VELSDTVRTVNALNWNWTTR